jgi:asparagine synthase (glutamine-hydrolysing)
MCGIAGILLTPAAKSVGSMEAHLDRMLQTLHHRGPDGAGTHTEGPLALGHRRLAIVDLSPLGRQPMQAASGRHVIAFNGEIYNHASLRQELQATGIKFRGRSDTEVLLALIDQVGLQPALERCTGMFAIALWDRATQTLHLARDRLGEKPLYWGRCNGLWLFGSELKALRAHPAFDAGIEPLSMAALLRHGYIPAPHSIHRGVSQVRPGAIVSITPGAEPVERRWWTPAQAVARGTQAPWTGIYEDAVTSLETLLRQAVGDQMQADVPLGAFLSGGIDSSLIVALMQAQASRAVQSYTIAFDESGVNEAPHAAAVARHLGTRHTELTVTSADALATVPLLASMYDEPLGDSSQIPTALVARLARQHVTVALSGDGGDEFFGGYRKYALGERLRAWPGRRALGAAMHGLPLGLLEGLERRVGRHRLASPRARSLRHWLSAADDRTLALRLSEMNACSDQLLALPVRSEVLQLDDTVPGLDYRRTAMLLDSQHYLPDDVLVKVDRATMHASLESRAPLLDHRIAEFAARLPTAWLCDARGGKRILREVLYRHVPAVLVDRPKQGFSVPLARWLRGELRGWASDLMQDSPRTSHLVNLPAARTLLDDHLQGRRDNSAALWPLLSLLAWRHHGWTS